VFQTVPLSTHHQEFFTVHTATVYVIQVCWQLASRIRTELVPIWSCSQVCTVKNSWWWTEELSETRGVSFQNKLEKLVQRVGFIIRICQDAWSHECKKKGGGGSSHTTTKPHAANKINNWTKLTNDYKTGGGSEENRASWANTKTRVFSRVWWLNIVDVQHAIMDLVVLWHQWVVWANPIQEDSITASWCNIKELLKYINQITYWYISDGQQIWKLNWRKLQWQILNFLNNLHLSQIHI